MTYGTLMYDRTHPISPLLHRKPTCHLKIIEIRWLDWLDYFPFEMGHVFVFGGGKKSQLQRSSSRVSLGMGSLKHRSLL